ncbi:hypothetical protein [Pigmentibacter ruber]|uniref:hypothetical protein n=1 Tax=Pigmentibacter ruber TaxID=2683196 RepID=UPI00131E5DF1|nr:hypothetical protein [Pigmentibacter ruber]BFD32069.1 hypothetical protein GTC16762_16870 [Pigmentibacter ruber]
MVESLVFGIISLSSSNFTLQYLENFFDFYNKKRNKEGLKEKVNVFLYSISDEYFKMNENELKNEVTKCIKNFQAINVFNLIVPCSELYFFKEIFFKNSNFDFYFSVSESINILKKSSLKKIAIISNDKSIEKNIFQDQLTANGVPYFWNENLLEMINEVIICTKQSGINAHVNRVFSNILAYLSLNQCDSILIDNFEIRTIFQKNKQKTHLKIFDTFHILNQQIFKSKLFFRDEENYKTAL